jgi:hypothetical protein
MIVAENMVTGTNSFEMHSVNGNVFSVSQADVWEMLM